MRLEAFLPLVALPQQRGPARLSCARLSGRLVRSAMWTFPCWTLTLVRTAAMAGAGAGGSASRPTFSTESVMPTPVPWLPCVVLSSCLGARTAKLWPAASR
ncbi:rCG42617 [Rattus norvegicus]|uniref:RCG42617 n=1 Tax=Rattus norvegicus TaxID=10116 RepID=A6K206_RAT|nr:rCG42617 [Rattus norvegicus]